MIRTDIRAQMHLAIGQILAETGGQLPRQSAAVLSSTFDVAVRSIYREANALKDLAATVNAGTALVGAAPRTVAPTVARPQVWWDDDDARQEVLTALGGAPTVAAAWRSLHADGVVHVSYPSFTKQLKQRLDPAVHAGLTAHGSNKGRNAYIDASLYCTEVTVGRNTRWQADVQYVPVRVRSATGTEVAEVFQITFLDEATRYVVGTMFTTSSPTGNDVAATIAASVIGHSDADGNFFGGLPQSIRWDNGSEFLNEVVSQACVQLGIIPIPSPPYTGWRKGKIERFHLTMQQRFFATLPGAVHGPKTFTGQRPWRGADADLMFLDAFVARSLQGVAEYNDVHVHSVLGCTPRQAWLRDTAPIRQAPAAALHPLMLAVPRTRIVAKDGISYSNVKYLSPTLARWRRRKVEIRVLPHDIDRIYVFNPKNKEFLCQAVPAAQLTAAQRQQLLAQRNEDYRQVKAAIAEGTARRAQEALIRATLETEQANRDHRAAQAAQTATAGDGDQPEEFTTDPAGDGLLRADIDAYLDNYGDDA